MNYRLVAVMALVGCGGLGAAEPVRRAAYCEGCNAGPIQQLGPRDSLLAGTVGEPAAWHGLSGSSCTCGERPTCSHFRLFGRLRDRWAGLCGLLGSMDECGDCSGVVGCSNHGYELRFVFGSCRSFFGCGQGLPPDPPKFPLLHPGH